MKIVTIGVYGFSESKFFQALQDAKIDTFCDIRLRRGMRGSEYAFVNSKRLQKKLEELGIRYIYVKDLAPSQALREKQKQEDDKSGISKRNRKNLGSVFIQEYERDCLTDASIRKFGSIVGTEVKVIGLFCVEREPEACHRSLAAKRLSEALDLPIEHINPLT